MGAMMFTYYALNTFWPTFLGSALHLGVGGKTLFLVYLNGSSLIDYWVAAWLSERIGRRPTLIGYALLAVASAAAVLSGNHRRGRVHPGHPRRLRWASACGGSSLPTSANGS
jgi:MFS family permease